MMVSLMYAPGVLPEQAGAEFDKYRAEAMAEFVKVEDLVLAA